MMTCPGPVHLERAVGHENLFPVRWNRSVPMAHHTTSSFKKRVLCHACHLFVQAKWIYDTYITRRYKKYMSRKTMTLRASGWSDCACSGACAWFSHAWQSRHAEVQGCSGTLCALQLLQCVFGLLQMFSRKLRKSPKHCEREVFGY